MSFDLPSEQELNMIRGKLSVNHADRDEIKDFLKYVTAIESLLDEADMQDVFGTEGWRRRIGISE